MKILAIIPARKGSKEIKKKNHLKINRKSLVEISILEAEKSKLLDRIIFSSDDLNLIKKVKRKKFKKVEIPFVRPTRFSHDRASSYSVLEHANNWLINNENWKADIIVLLQPTTPFRTVKIIDDVISLLLKNKYADAAITITEPDYPPHWMYVKKGSRLVPLISNGKNYVRRQDTPKVYKPAGLVYAFRTKFFKKQRKISIPTSKTLGYYIDQDISLNIDNYNQYLLSKLKLKKNFK